jgi:MoaA/NifB/PqqE/SkfB family radical SAM enzyme
MKIRSIRWDITHKCTQNCTHCYAASYRRRENKNEPNLEELYRIIDQLTGAGITEFSLTGGDVLLNKYLPHVLRKLKENDCWVELVANMINLTDNLYEQLCDPHIAPNRICCAVNGSTAEFHERLYGKNSFTGVSNMIRLMNSMTKRNLPADFTANVMVIKPTKNQIVETIEFCSQSGFNTVYLSKVVRVGNAVRNWSDLALSPKEIISLTYKIISSVSSLEKLSFAYLTPVAIDFIYKKHGALLAKQFSGCAFSYELYLDNFGKLYPCQCISELKRSGKGYCIDFTNISLLKNDFNKIFNGISFAQEQDRISKGLYKKYRPCGQCKYSKSFCMPCHRYLDFGVTQPFELCSYINDLAPFLFKP